MMWYVYLITNLVNGNLYVGKTNNIDKRWLKHKRISAGGKTKYPYNYKYFHSAISKYGVKNFELSVLDNYELETQALVGEIKHIARLKVEGYKLYNLTDGGDGVSGYKHSDETKQKISLAKIGKKLNEDHKNALVLSRLDPSNKCNPGHTTPHSEETKRKISSSNCVVMSSPDIKKKLSLLGSGEGNSQSKLTWNDVDQIRTLRLQGVSCTKLSSQFNVTIATISNICSYKAWKNKPT